MNTYINVSGTNQRISRIYTKISNSWVSVKNAWVNNDGVWQKVFGIFTQLGQDIYGESTGNNFGYSVSMNSAGDRVAIGSQYDATKGYHAGSTRVYKLSGSTWTQLGQDIDAEAAGDLAGYSVSMNAAGDRVAIGALDNDGGGVDSGSTRIYTLSGSTWVQTGQDINGEAAGDSSGYSVSINSIGDRVAIGALRNKGTSASISANKGSTRIYTLSGSTWVQLGQDIDGEADYDNAARVSINSIGDRVAIGAYQNDGNGSNSGSTRIYTLSGSTWIQLGQDIDGEASSDYSGWNIAMNAAGDRVAIGAYGNDGNGSNSGSTRIYTLSGSTWIQLGQDIDGEASNDYSGYGLSINAVGDRVAIGAYNNAGSTVSPSGSTRIYSLVGSTWIQFGQDIDGKASGDQFGIAVSMNAAGDRIAIGARNHSIDVNNINIGYTRMYSLSL